jgi:hypothetical protein
MPVASVSDDSKSPGEMSFTKQCPKLLAIADDFAHECLKRARSFSRDFYPESFSGGFLDAPEKEEHAAYFRAVDTGSHFGLGCTLNQDHKINFLGVYYAAKSSSFTKANTAPLSYIDFQGNVGLQVDGKVVNLMALRQFGTDFIPLRYRILGTEYDPSILKDPHVIPPVKNCESPNRPDGRVNSPGASYFISESQDHGEHVITICVDNPNKKDPGCRSSSYIDYFPNKNQQIIDYEQLSALWLIRDGGGLSVSKKQYEIACHAPNDVSIVKEMCEQSK